MFFYLIYTSKAYDRMSNTALEELLQKSRECNKKQHITGMLLYICREVTGLQEGRFIQVLEGKEEIIRLVFQKIKTDPRHYDIEVLSEMPIAQRNFKDWTMGFERLDENASSKLPDFFNLTSDYFDKQKKHAFNPSFKLLELFYNLFHRGDH